ncbi:lipopolysaccharide assembly protein LapB [Marinobacterium litorale]|uniref:lipopolysaccharide assembly protein LapB n=1 Tax=Marinobacterium litorale TaxID=404770 RepID=UPI000415CDAA|nr:lipopolysaccharide assembly protein LapB [Marinobacterium litorale]
MELDPLLLTLLFAAIAIGWLLGRAQVKRTTPSADRSSCSDSNLNPEYFQGLNYLMSDRTDEAIESFIRALEINSDTIPAHLALARLLRRKGDVERAIRVHQTLLARPGLSRTDFHRIQMALARDYEASGLLDRAENLLAGIITDHPSDQIAVEARKLLIKLYEKEGEWLDALEVGRKLSSSEQQAMANELSQYCCELAERALDGKRWNLAEQYLREADGFDTHSVRASLLLARRHMEQDNWSRAIKALCRVREQDPGMVSETIADLKRCYEASDRLSAFDRYLDTCLATAPSTTVMLARAERLCDEQGVIEAGLFITDELKKRPSVRGLNRLIDMHLAHGSDSARESLTVLRGLTGQLEADKPKYQCGHCGYAGRTLLWQCPSCRQWNKIRPIQGLEGE